MTKGGSMSPRGCLVRMGSADILSMSESHLSANSAASSEWSMYIGAKKPLFDVPWRQLWQYRDLILLFVHRNFTATYKQTILGPLWYVIQPLITTLMFVVVFGKIAKISTDGIPPTLFYMSGVVMWSYFSTCFTGTANTFNANAGIFGKVYFPRLSVPISIVLTNLVGFGLQMGIFVAFYIYFISLGTHVAPNWWLLYLPVIILQMAMLGLGVGCIISSLTTRYRDLGMLVGFGTQLWMYASCVVMPLSSVPPEWRTPLVLVNPMVSVIEAFRLAVLGAGAVEPWQLAVSFAISAFLLFFGVIIFGRVEKNFVDTV